MSELILKTKAGAEFWTDTDDCTAEGNFNVFYFASHDDEQPQAVANDCDSWAAAADQLAGYVKPTDWEAFKYEFLSARAPIVESVSIDFRSRDTFDADTDTEYSAVSGIAWLSDCIAGNDENTLVFNLYVPTHGAPYVSFLSPLPAAASLAEETLEAAILKAAESDIAAIRDVIATEHIKERVTEALKFVRKAGFCLNAAIEDARTFEPFKIHTLPELAKKVDSTERAIALYVDWLY